MKNMTSVPLPVYENEVRSKNRIIAFQFILIALLIAILGVSIYLFVSFIGAYDFQGYAQDGDGVNNINTGTQGDVLNESEINK